MIIGVVGPLCSGKDTVGAILAEAGFEVISLGDILREEMKEKGIEITRLGIQEYVRSMRREHGDFYPAHKVASRLVEGKRYVIQGFRNKAEALELKKLEGSFLIALDSSEEVRFERMKERFREKDPIDFEEFKKVDSTELHGHGSGGFGFNIRAAMDLADTTVINDSGFEDLKVKILGLVGGLKLNL